MTNPSSPTPAVEPLGEERIAEIETDHTQGRNRFHSNRREVLALCQSLRAARSALKIEQEASNEFQRLSEDLIARLRDQINHFESPDDENKCRFCGNLRTVPYGHVQKCYCIPTIRQYRDENAALREQLAQLQLNYNSLRESHAQLEEDYSTLVTGKGEVESQLAQVEKERDEWKLRAQAKRKAGL